MSDGKTSVVTTVEMVDSNRIKSDLKKFGGENGTKKDVAALFDGKTIPKGLALAEIRPILTALRRKGMSPREISVWLKDRYGIEVKERKIAVLAPAPTRKTRGKSSREIKQPRQPDVGQTATATDKADDQASLLPADKVPHDTASSEDNQLPLQSEIVPDDGEDVRIIQDDEIAQTTEIDAVTDQYLILCKDVIAPLEGQSYMILRTGKVYRAYKIVSDKLSVEGDTFGQTVTRIWHNVV